METITALFTISVSYLAFCETIIWCKVHARQKQIKMEANEKLNESFSMLKKAIHDHGFPDLTGANLSGADLTGASLSGAKLK